MCGCGCPDIGMCSNALTFELVELQILPEGANSVTAKISPPLWEYMPHAGLSLLATINDQCLLQLHCFEGGLSVPFSFSLDFVEYSGFAGVEAMFRRKSNFSRYARACARKKRGDLCGCGGELGKIGGIANLWRFADFMCRDVATVSLLANCHFPKVARFIMLPQRRQSLYRAMTQGCFWVFHRMPIYLHIYPQ